MQMYYFKKSSPTSLSPRPLSATPSTTRKFAPKWLRHSS